MTMTASTTATARRRLGRGGREDRMGRTGEELVRSLVLGDGGECDDVTLWRSHPSPLRTDFQLVRSFGPTYNSFWNDLQLVWNDFGQNFFLFFYFHRKAPPDGSFSFSPISLKDDGQRSHPRGAVAGRRRRGRVDHRRRGDVDVCVVRVARGERSSRGGRHRPPPPTTRPRGRRPPPLFLPPPPGGGRK